MRFRLRTLLLLVSVACIVAGFYFNRAHVEGKSRDRLRKSGLKVAYAYWDRGPQVEPELVFENSHGPMWLRGLGSGCLTDHIKSLSKNTLGRLVKPGNFRDSEVAKTGLWIGSKYVDGQRSAELMGDGGGVSDADLILLEGLNHVERLHLGFNLITDVGLSHIAHLRSLRSLCLAGTKITDAGMVHLTALTNLEDLVLEFTCVSDEGLAPLKGLSKIKSIALMNTKVAGPGFVHLARLQRLENLSLPGTTMKSGHLEPLRECKALRDLCLWDTEIDDEAGAHLAAMGSLEQLGLDGTKVGDACIRKIAGLQRLKTISLNRTQVTDDCLSVLEGIPSLRHIYVDQTNVSDDGRDRIHKEMQRRAFGDLGMVR